MKIIIGRITAAVFFFCGYFCALKLNPELTCALMFMYIGNSLANDIREKVKRDRELNK